MDQNDSSVDDLLELYHLCLVDVLVKFSDICLTGYHLFLCTQPALAQIFNKSLVRYGSFSPLSARKCSGEESNGGFLPKRPQWIMWVA